MLSGPEMTILHFLLYLAVAGLAGSIGKALAGYSNGGCLVSIGLGFVGAVLGTWMARLLGLPEVLSVRIGKDAFPLVWSILGAALFVAILGALSQKRQRTDPPRR
jgi:uncharacterized membrane protein YeaQ/YmgE (transglycosylase-associated protein family)